MSARTKGPFVVGMIGNLIRARRGCVAAKVIGVFPNGRLNLAVYTSHSDRMLFGDRARLPKNATVRPDGFSPCDDRVQPPDVRAALALAVPS